MANRNSLRLRFNEQCENAVMHIAAHHRVSSHARTHSLPAEMAWSACAKAAKMNVDARVRQKRRVARLDD
jgi:hypothetical protein